ncbi:31287_t:CDS:1, partial [Gigaspora margarita]
MGNTIDEEQALEWMTPMIKEVLASTTRTQKFNYENQKKLV